MMILVHQTFEMTLQNVFQTPDDHLREKTHLFPFILELPIFAEDFLSSGMEHLYRIICLPQKELEITSYSYKDPVGSVSSIRLPLPWHSV